MEPRDLLQSLAQPGPADLSVTADWGPIQTLIATWIPAGITLHQPVVETATAEAVTLSGTLASAATGRLLWAAGATVRVELTLQPATQNAPENLAGTVYLQAPAGWTFSSAFPGMPKTADLRDLANPTQTPLLDGLGLAKTWLVLTTQGIDTNLTLAGQGYGPVQLNPGLGVVSRLTTAGVVGVLTALASEVTLAGTFVAEGAESGLTVPIGQFPWDLPTSPGAHLTARFTPDLVIGTGLQTALSFRVYTPLSQNWLEANPAFEPLMAMEGDLTLAQAGITARLVATRMLGQSDRVEWLASFDAGAHAGINVDDLAALIGDGHQAGFLKTYLPESVANALATVSLKGLSIELGADANGGHRVVNTGLYLGVDTGKVTLIENVVSLDAVEVVEVIVRDPFGSDLPLSDRVMGTLVFDATLLGASVLGMLSLPNFSIELQLAEEKTISIDALFQERGLDPALKPAALIVEDFFVRANLDGDFGIGARIAEAPAWTIDLGVTSVALAEVAFSANRFSWGDKSASFSAVLKLGDPAGETVDLSVSADVRTGAEAGWRFRGALQPDSTLSVGSFIEKLAHHFGEVTPPASVANLVVDAFSVDFDTGKQAFSGAMAVTFPLDGEERHVRLGVDITHQASDGGYDKTFTLTLGGLRFVLIDRADLVLATYEGDVSLKPRLLAASLSPALAADIPDGIELTIKEAFFLHKTDPPAGDGSGKPTGRSLFGIELGARFDLSALPILGQALPGDTLAVDQLRFLMASAAFTADEVRVLNPLLPAAGAIPLPAASASLPAGPTVAAQLMWSGQTKPLFLDARPPVASGQSPANTPVNTPAPAAGDGATWFTVDRTFGPLHISRVGARFKDNILRFLVDGALGAGGFNLSLMGLEVGSPIAAFSPEFDLQGLGLSVDAGDLTIRGAFLHVHHDAAPNVPAYDEYAGKAELRMESFALGAIGSYAVFDQHPSLFVYAVLDTPIGGPAFFFVTGLSAGFGYNRALRMPAIDQVAAFPLVAEAINGTAGNDLAAELRGLETYLPPSPGDLFLTAGIRFTSFKLIESFALLGVRWGHRVEIDVLGLSTLIAPTAETNDGPDPLAMVQLALKATYLPDEGFLGVAAQLTSTSYILSKSCHISGGFAFYGWFAGDHEDDFALSIGGYHPAYHPPAHYPVVPRLGFNWQVSDALSVSGQSYFALVPSAIMAGARLEALWTSGDLKAWFIADANFLIAWKPYHYEARLYVDMGVSYTFNHFGRHTFTADIGADLSIWGPEFSGTATVSLWIVSFTVSFGATTANTRQPVSWASFATMLPAASDRLQIGVEKGLLKPGPAVAGHLGVLHPLDLAIAIQSAVPISQVAGLSVDGASGDVGITPMDLRSVDSVLSVTITGPTRFTSAAALRKPQPTALWGNGGITGAGQELTEPLMYGIRLVAPAPAEPDFTPAITRTQLGVDTTMVTKPFADPPASPWISGPLAAPSSAPVTFDDWPLDAINPDYFSALLRGA